MEEWRDVPGYEGLYLLNKKGDIYSKYSNKELKPSISMDGYKQFVLYKNHKPELMLAHRAVALAFIPRENEGLVVNHKDENKLNCNVDNLEWVTRTYNTNYNGNHAKQATINSRSKEFFVYDKSLRLVGKYKGVNKYARDNKLSKGTLVTNLIHNSSCGLTEYYTYYGLIYSYVTLPHNLIG